MLVRVKFKMNDLFDPGFMDVFLEINGLTRVNEYPELEKLLIRYRFKVKRAAVFPCIPMGEVYTDKVNINAENYYEVSWSIKAAKRIIKRDCVPVCRCSLADVSSAVDRACINHDHLKVAITNEAPIIIAEYPPLPGKQKFFIIDGNHRIIAKLADGQKEIPGHFLAPAEHMTAMVGELHRTLFKIHYNYWLISRYLGDRINLAELAQALCPL